MHTVPVTKANVIRGLLILNQLYWSQVRISPTDSSMKVVLPWVFYHLYQNFSTDKGYTRHFKKLRDFHRLKKKIQQPSSFHFTSHTNVG